MLVVKPKSTGGFYREDAARLASEAARVPKQQEVPLGPAAPAPVTAAPASIAAAPEPPPQRIPAEPAIPAIEIDRPRLRPDPADNQNVRRPRPVTELDEDDEPRRWGIGRIIAWVLLAPWYVAMAAAAIGVDVLFVKDLLGF